MKKLIMCIFTILLALATAACGNGNQSVETTIATTPTVNNITISLGKTVGTYSGEVDDSEVPNGEGTYTTKAENISYIFTGKWKDGIITTGTLECFYNDESLGTASIIDSYVNDDDLASMDDKYSELKKEEALDKGLEKLDTIIDIGKDFISLFD